MKIFSKLFKKKKVIGVISLKGIIGSKKGQINHESYADLIKQAFETKGIIALFLKINSPGGSPSQSEYMFKYINLMKQKYPKVKVICSIEDIAASGGLYISMAADYIISLENAIVGSIGVISAGFGFTDAIKKLGIERRVYTQGECKNILDPFLPENSKDVEILLSMQQDVLENFTNVVTSSRADKLKDKNIFNGMVWSGKGALEIGLIDEITTMDEYIEKEYGKDCEIKKFEHKKKGLMAKLGLDDFSMKAFLDNLTW